jgi:hypothetical protein
VRPTRGKNLGVVFVQYKKEEEEAEKEEEKEKKEEEKEKKGEKEDLDEKEAKGRRRFYF